MEWTQHCRMTGWTLAASKFTAWWLSGIFPFFSSHSTLSVLPIAECILSLSAAYIRP